MSAPAPSSRRWRQRLMRVLVGAVLGAALVVMIGGRMGLFAGKRPEALGYKAGRFEPCSWKPNCVNSTADAKADAAHYIEPIAFKGDPAAAWQRLKAIVQAAPRAAVVREDGQYLYAEFSSRLMGYTDDVEFALDAAGSRIHVRSASRLGVRDFGVNRARVDGIRARFAAGS